MRHIGNVVYSQGYQGFESLRLRQEITPPLRGYFLADTQADLTRSQRSCKGSTTSRFWKCKRTKIVTVAPQAFMPRKSLRLRHDKKTPPCVVFFYRRGVRFWVLGASLSKNSIKQPENMI